MDKNEEKDESAFLQRYNHVQWKAAHNSVEREETIFEQLDPHDGMCGGIELDFVVGMYLFSVPV